MLEYFTFILALCMYAYTRAEVQAELWLKSSHHNLAVLGSIPLHGKLGKCSITPR